MIIDEYIISIIIRLLVRIYNHIHQWLIHTAICIWTKLLIHTTICTRINVRLQIGVLQMIERV